MLNDLVLLSLLSPLVLNPSHFHSWKNCCYSSSTYILLGSSVLYLVPRWFFPFGSLVLIWFYIVLDQKFLNSTYLFSQLIFFFSESNFSQKLSVLALALAILRSRYLDLLCFFFFFSSTFTPILFSPLYWHACC